jgi:hypothetical protein
MKIFFYNSGNQKLGSNRIYISNLSSWLREININCIVSNNLNDSKNADFAILNKFSKLSDIRSLKKINPDCRFGLIHPSDLQTDFLKKLKYINFFITGSIEERDHYLLYNKNIFRFPQIEKINPILNKHSNKNKFITLGYHGNLEHLNEMDSNARIAIEKISQTYNIKLIAVYDMSLGRWSKGRPNIEIKEVDWTFENMVNEMSKVDIGIVPCTNKFLLDTHYSKSNFIKRLIKKFYGRSNDYNLQFKVTSNSGRAFVFHQLGVPVVADFWPSNFEILDNNESGFLAHSIDGWYYSLEKLIQSSELRDTFSINAQKQFVEKYNPYIWSKAFLKFLDTL